MQKGGVPKKEIKKGRTSHEGWTRVRYSGSSWSSVIHTTSIVNSRFVPKKAFFKVFDGEGNPALQYVSGLGFWEMFLLT